MSGVIDERGVQWERVNCCGKFVRFDKLKYEQPSKAYPYGRDLCAEHYMPQEGQLRVLRVMAALKK